ncbi:unnamed protein product [Scytosiphon promiscuus]
MYISKHLDLSPSSSFQHTAAQILFGSGATRRSHVCLPHGPGTQPATAAASQKRPLPSRHRYSPALFMRAGGGPGQGAAGGASSISADWVAVEGEGRGGARKVRGASDTDVPNTVNYNGKTLTFGNYRRPSLLERCTIALAAVGLVGWKALFAFRRMRRTWSKVAVAVVAPGIAWILRSFIAYFYREIVLQPKLRSPESVAFANSRFEEIDGLKVHSLREDPRADGEEAPRCVLHMNHGFGASSSSWSPVIKTLSRELGALAIAHDTPGFGLTARAGLLEANRYSLRNNAAITTKFVKAAVKELGEPPAAPQRRYILMGHSMGCITASTAAIDPSLSAKETTLVLVAPALSLPSSLKKATAERRRASDRLAARETATGGPADVSEARVDSDDGVLRGGRGGGSGGSRRAGGASPASGRIIGTGGDVVRAVVRAPVRAAETVLHSAVWVFNRCLLPMIYPLEILGLRALVYNGNFWRKALRQVWVDDGGVDLDIINRYRWPTLVRYWDRGFALFLLDRLQIGKGGRVGPSGLVEAVAAKAAEGMKVIVIQGDKDVLVSADKAKAIAECIPGAKLVLLPECGHVPHEEKAEEFLRLALEQLGHENGGATTRVDATGGLPNAGAGHAT